MKTANLVVFSVLLIGMLIASSVSGFEKGENRMRNSDFEADSVGEPPKEWALEKGG